MAFIREKYISRDDWLNKRTAGIGGSDVSCIVGFNPYKSNVQLWKEKMRLVEPQEISNIELVEYGSKAEEFIRAIFELDYKEFLKVEHTNEILFRKDKPYIRGSLDGELEVLQDFKFMSYWKPFYNKGMEKNIIPSPIELKKGMKGILEIKTTEVVSSMHKEKWHNAIPMNYYCQVLHYLLITDYDFVILRAQLKHQDANNVKTLETRDYGFLRVGKEEDLEYLEHEVDNFWNEYILKNIEPPLKINF